MLAEKYKKITAIRHYVQLLNLPFEINNIYIFEVFIENTALALSLSIAAYANGRVNVHFDDTIL